MMEDVIAFRALPSDAQIERVREIIGGVVQTNYRHETALMIVVRLLCGESLSSEELRSCYSDDSARYMDVVRNKFLIPVRTQEGGSYSMLPGEVKRFLSSVFRVQQRRACIDLLKAQQDRRKARSAIKLERDYGRNDLPEWYRQMAAERLPSVRRGLADFTRG